MNMYNFIFSPLILFILFSAFGCSGTGLEKKTTLVPDSVTIGWGQETHDGDPKAWQGFNISGTWTFK